MVQLNGNERNNFFVGVYSCPGLEGSGDNTFKMENSRGENTYLALPNPSGYITVYPPKMIERLEEKVSEASLSDPQAQSLLMELFSRRILSVATSREDQFERQAFRSCRNQRKGSSCGQVFEFRNLVGKSEGERG